MEKKIISCIAASPTTDGAPVLWKAGEQVPGTPGLFIQRMIRIGGGIEVYATAVEGSPLDQDIIKENGVRCGFQFVINPLMVRVSCLFAPINVLTEMAKVAEENSDDNIEEEEEDEDDEDETGGGEEVQPLQAPQQQMPPFQPPVQQQVFEPGQVQQDSPPNGAPEA